MKLYREALPGDSGAIRIEGGLIVPIELNADDLTLLMGSYLASSYRVHTQVAEAIINKIKE